jgi:hypothetical protein
VRFLSFMTDQKTGSVSIVEWSQDLNPGGQVLQHKLLTPHRDNRQPSPHRIKLYLIHFHSLPQPSAVRAGDPGRGPESIG